MPAESSRQEWEEGYRRIQAERGDRRRYRTLMADVDTVRDDLRRRVGQTFTIDELARVYHDADAWMRDVVSSPARPSARRGGGVPPPRARRDGLHAVTAAPRPRPRPPRRRVNRGRLIAGIVLLIVVFLLGHRLRKGAQRQPQDPARARPSCGRSIHCRRKVPPRCLELRAIEEWRGLYRFQSDELTRGTYR